MPGFGHKVVPILRTATSHWWRAFIRWRDRYRLTRVAILLLLFLPIVIPPLSGRGWHVSRMRRGQEHRRLTFEPRHAWVLARYYRSIEVLKLRKLLWLELDTDRNGALDGRERQRALGAGLDPSELETHVYRADIPALVGAGRQLELLPRSVTAVGLRRDAYYAAVAESGRFFREDHARIEAMISAPREWPDYGRAGTWQEGIDNFIWRLFEVLGPPLQIPFLLVFCGGLAAAAGAALPAHRRSAAALVGALAALLPARVALTWFDSCHILVEEWMVFPAYSLAGAGTGCAFSRLARETRHRLLTVLAAVAAAVLATVLHAATFRAQYYWYGDFMYEQEGWTATQLGFVTILVGSAALTIVRWVAGRFRPGRTGPSGLAPLGTEGGKGELRSNGRSGPGAGAGRRSRWWLRLDRLWRNRSRAPVVIVAVLLGPVLIAMPVGGCVMLRLARGAIDRMREPSVAHDAWVAARRNRLIEARELQELLRLELDADRSGLVEAKEVARAAALGLTASELNGRPDDESLEGLLCAARELHLIPKGETAARIRRVAWDAGIAEARRVLDGRQAEVTAPKASPAFWPLMRRAALFAVGLAALNVAACLAFAIGRRLRAANCPAPAAKRRGGNRQKL